MITNGNSIDNGETLKAQVCVVGSGPAGVTVAWFLQKAGIDVILLEGSRQTDTTRNNYQNTWPDKTLLYNGKATGQFATNEPQFLIRGNDSYPNSPTERERAYGGTSTHWGGQSRPLDAVALEGRGANYPAWPISRAELEPYYVAAAAFCKLHGADFTADFWANLLGDTDPKLEGFETAMYQFIGGNYLDFATSDLGGSTIGDSNAKVIQNATLLNINHSGGKVTSLSVGTMNDATPPAQLKSFTVVADQYIMALGAVANARQLLLAGIPNDNIGRYFMCHPLVQNWIDQQGSPITVNGSYLTAAEQNLMNGDYANGQQFQDANGVKVTGRFSPNAQQQKSLEIGSCWFWAGTGGNGFYFEQAPNPNSRITLMDTVDTVFKQKQIQINWEFSPADENTYNQVVSLYNKAVQAKNPSASVTAVPWSEIQSRAVVNGHHLGTTRMSETAADGVVDKNLKSHDLDNLYVAGSSVWRTACIPNPTFSIITFSMRLADQLIGANVKGITKDAKGNLAIHGKLLDGQPGWKVEAWDKDLITKDDLFGSAIPDELGYFHISYDSSSHKEWIFDQKPDVYFKVYNANGTLVYTSKVVKNATVGIPLFVVSENG